MISAISDVLTWAFKNTCFKKGGIGVETYVTSDATRACKCLYVVVTNNGFSVPNLLQEFLDAVEVVVGYSVSLEIHDHFLHETKHDAVTDYTVLVFNE